MGAVGISGGNIEGWLLLLLLLLIFCFVFFFFKQKTAYEIGQ